MQRIQAICCRSRRRGWKGRLCPVPRFKSAAAKDTAKSKACWNKRTRIQPNKASKMINYNNMNWPAKTLWVSIKSGPSLQHASIRLLRTEKTQPKTRALSGKDLTNMLPKRAIWPRRRLRSSFTIIPTTNRTGLILPAGRLRSNNCSMPIQEQHQVHILTSRRQFLRLWIWISRKCKTSQFNLQILHLGQMKYFPEMNLVLYRMARSIRAIIKSCLKNIKRPTRLKRQKTIKMKLITKLSSS